MVLQTIKHLIKKAQQNNTVNISLALAAFSMH